MFGWEEKQTKKKNPTKKFLILTEVLKSIFFD